MNRVIDWKDPAARLSIYFTVGEMTLGDPRRIPRDPLVMEQILRFAQELDQVRAAWGSGGGDELVSSQFDVNFFADCPRFSQQS